MKSLLTAETGRLDRHVRRSYLHLGTETSRHRAAFSLEEALRLSNLPGEEEGRIYCFRRVSLSGVEAEANRRVWIHAVGRVMEELAAQALHGSHPFADSSNAVYFHSRDEALETLLRRALQGLEPGAATSPCWFSSALLEASPGTSHETQIRTLVEELQRSANPAAGAALFFAALGEKSPALLMSAIPEEEFRAWIRALDSAASAFEAQFVALPDRLAMPLRRAGVACGWTAPGTVWLAVQALICSAPGSVHSASLVSRARSTLRHLQTQQRGADQAVFPAPRGRTTLRFDDDTENEARNCSLLKTSPEEQTNAAEQDGSRNDSAGVILEGRLDSEAGSSSKATSGDVTKTAAHVPMMLVEALPPLLGERTASAGLFFLLHALRHLGVPALVGHYPALAEAGFAGHILRSLADKLDVPGDDSIRMCLPSSDAYFSLPDEVLRDAEFACACEPEGFHRQSTTPLHCDLLLRVWTMAVRRWCWRTAHLTAKEIVHRSGRVWLTRTDLDVTLPLSLTDIRIRRMGLDIDPGWVPWLGQFGKVVRFHYREGE